MVPVVLCTYFAAPIGGGTQGRLPPLVFQDIMEASHELYA